MSKYTFEEKYEAVQRVLDGNRWFSVPIKKIANPVKKGDSSILPLES